SFDLTAFHIICSIRLKIPRPPCYSLFPYTTLFRSIWPFMVYTAIVFALVGLILGLSYVLGQRHRDRATGEPYESGILSTGSARLRFPSQFCLVSMLFVIFDVEAVFIITWAIAFEELGWSGYLA